MNEAELLFSQILDCDRTYLYLNQKLHLDADKLRLVSSVLKRRIKGEPIQHILGRTEFMGLELKINRDVFIPRPETEILVETALRVVTSYQLPVTSPIILDMGTGSGCIAISLAKFIGNVKITATDISGEAIEVAKYNASLNSVAEKISFVQSDLFSGCRLRLSAYDMIVSNPPYIPTAQIQNLQPEIRFEPVIALDGGRDGLDFYRNIINESPYYLREGGFLIMEIGFDQRDALARIFQNSGELEILEFVRDYNNIDRVIVAKTRGKWTN